MSEGRVKLPVRGSQLIFEVGSEVGSSEHFEVVVHCQESGTLVARMQTMGEPTDDEFERLKSSGQAVKLIRG